jgi:hypothetical protein
MSRQHSRQALRSCGSGDGNTCCNPHSPVVLSVVGCRSDTCLTRQRGTVDLHAMRCTWTVRFDLLVSFGGRDGGLVHMKLPPLTLFLSVLCRKEPLDGGECMPMVHAVGSRGRRHQRRVLGCSDARGSRPPPTAGAMETTDFLHSPSSFRI